MQLTAALSFPPSDIIVPLLALIRSYAKKITPRIFSLSIALFSFPLSQDFCQGATNLTHTSVSAAETKAQPTTAALVVATCDASYFKRWNRKCIQLLTFLSLTPMHIATLTLLLLSKLM